MGNKGLHCAKTWRSVYTLSLYQLLIKGPPLNTLIHLPLEHPNSLRRCTVTKNHTDGHTSPLQIIMHLLIRLEQFENFYGRMIDFLLVSLVIKFLGVLLTCYSLLEPPLSWSLIWSKTLMELMFNPCGKFRWSLEGPVSQINSPHLLFGAPGIYSDLLRSVQMLKREWGVESNGKLPHLLNP